MSGWVTKKLGEIGTCKNGLNFKRAAVGKAIDIVGVSDFKKGLVVDDTTDLERLTLQELPEQEWYLQPNDIVFVRSNGSKALVGRAVIIKTKRPLTFSGFCIRYRIEDKSVDPDYLVRMVSAENFRRAMLVGRNASTINNVTQLILLSQVIRFPPLPEQKRIVAKIDAAFEKIDKLKANAEKNLANAKELFQSALDEAMRPKKGWVEKRLGEVANIRVGPFGSSLHKADYVDNGVPLVNPCHMKDSKIADRISTQVSHDKAESLKEYRLKAGDIVFARRGEIGRLAFVSEKEDGYLCGTGSLFARFRERYDIQFLYFFFSSKSFVERLEQLSTGTTMKSINSSALESMSFSVPPMNDQQRLAKELDSLSQKTKALQQNYARQVADCAEMRQAILREAFEGRLCMREKGIPLALAEQGAPVPRKIGVSQGMWHFPEDWEEQDKALDAEIAEDFYAD